MIKHLNPIKPRNTVISLLLLLTFIFMSFKPDEKKRVNLNTFSIKYDNGYHVTFHDPYILANEREGKASIYARVNSNTCGADYKLNLTLMDSNGHILAEFSTQFFLECSEHQKEYRGKLKSYDNINRTKRYRWYSPSRPNLCPCR